MSVEPDQNDVESTTQFTTVGAGPAPRTKSSTEDSAAPAGEPVAEPTESTVHFDRILVVADDTRFGNAAVEAGVDLAATHGGTVDALYVVDTTEHWDVVVERRERIGERVVEAAAARGEQAGVAVEKWFRYGTAHEEVLGFAAAHDVDVVVIGSARRTGLDRLIHPEMLPVRVQRGVSIPVLVVGADDN